MMGDDNFCQEIVGTKSDEHVKKRNIMKMKLWKKVMKQFIEEKSDEHEVAVDTRIIFL